MNILIPIVGFGAAGGNRVLSELANHWCAAGHRVDFLVDQRSTPPYFPTCAGIVRYVPSGAIAEHTDPKMVGGFAARGNGASIYGGMWRALGRIGAQYDVILANHSMTAIPVALARTGRAKKFYYVQAYEPEYYALERGARARGLQWLSALSYRLPLQQIANSPIYLGYRGIRARDWVPPGLDPRVFYRREAVPMLGSDRPCVIGVIGRREPSKGTRFALEAFEQLAAVNSQARLIVAFGNLPEGWAHERAQVVTPQNDAELADFYRSVDVLLAPGTVQLGACHYPVLEAMATGTPVVTTGYLPADRDNAWIVAVADSAAIASAIQSIIAMPTGELACKLDRAHQAVSGFYWEAVAEKFLRLIDAAVAD